MRLLGSHGNARLGRVLRGHGLTGSDVLQRIFTNGEVGGVIDLSPVYPHQQLFQDTAGLQPVTAPGQTVALAKMRPVGIEFAQANASLRPTYAVRPKGGRKNLLLATDTLTTQSVTVAAVPHILHFTGTGTVTLSGASTAGPLAGSGVDTRASLTFTPTAGSLTLTVTGTVTLAQLQLGSTVNSYQRVTTAFDVYEAGQPHYGALWFDGVDDGMVSGTVTPGTDKVQVFTGVRKASDAVRGMILELSPGGALRSFLLDHAFTTADGMRMLLLGNNPYAVIPTASVPEKISHVVVATGDAAGLTTEDQVGLAINGSSSATVYGNTPTSPGDIPAHPLYMGRRAGTSLPFNGEIEGYLGFRFGPNLSDAQLAQIAATINAKTGAYA